MSQGKILIIDDNPQDAAAIETLLTENDFFVRVTDSKVSIADQIGEGRYDIIVIDLNLKHHDGFAAVREIKSLDANQEVIVVSAKKDVQTVVNLLKFGIRDLLLKPIKSEQFLSVTYEVIGRIKQKVTPETKPEATPAKERSPLLRALLDMLSILDSERLIQDMLDLLMRATGAQGALIWLAQSSGETTRLAFTAARGLVSAEEQWAFFPIEKDVFKHALAAEAPFTEKVNDREEAEESLFLPFVFQGELLGLARISEKQEGEDFTPSDFRSVKYIGDFAAVALSNTRRYTAIQKQTLRDHETHAYNLAYFNDYIRKETYKARRYDRPFSIVKLQFDNWPMLKKKYDENTVLKAREDVVEIILDLLREADLVAKKTESDFLILLPETDYFGSLMSIRRIRKAIASHRYVTDGMESSPLGVILTSATFPKDGKNFEALEEEIERRSELNRTSVYNKFDLEDTEFWSIVEKFIGRESGYDSEGSGTCLDQDLRNLDDQAGITRHGIFNKKIFDSVEAMINSEIRKNPNNRGILYLGAGTIEPDLPFLELGLPLHINSTKIFIVGEKKINAWKAPNITPIYLSDENIIKHRFILYLNEQYAYTLMAQRGENTPFFGFHSADQVLTENLISKLQDNYFMQKQL